MAILSKILKLLGLVLSTSTLTCPKFIVDEPEMPKSMIERY